MQRFIATIISPHGDAYKWEIEADRIVPNRNLIRAFVYANDFSVGLEKVSNGMMLVGEAYIGDGFTYTLSTERIPGKESGNQF